ncbi:MAG: hypothetical protein ACJ0UT_00055 [Candidatus Latescibacterota bacterium]
MIWTLLTFLLVALTKYITSLRLRNLRDKVQQDQQVADELRKKLTEFVEKESILKDEAEQLMGKANTMHNLISNIERSIEKAGEK